MPDIQTNVSPPEPDQDDEGSGSRSTRVSVSVIKVDDTALDAGLQLLDDDAASPDRIAEALLRTALAAANLAGPDVAWAAMRRFADYQGGAPDA